MNCNNCKYGQIYKTYYGNEKFISCNDEIKQIIHKMNITELYNEMENHKNGKCKFFENGKPNKNIIISYDD